MTAKTSISISDEQNAFARALVDSGKYSSMSAVVQQALNIMMQRTDREEVTTAALKALLNDRQRGQFISADAMGDAVSDMFARKRGAGSVED